MTKTEKEKHLRDKMLLYARYQTELAIISSSIEKEFLLLKEELSKSIDDVLESIDSGLKKNDIA